MIYAFMFKLWLLTQATHAPMDHVWAATQAETPRVPATLLLAQSWKESRWTRDAVSRIELINGARVRRMGTVKGKFPSRFRGPYYCGASQLQRKTESACRKIGQDLQANYTEAVQHIEQWLAHCKKTGQGKFNLDCAIAGYAGGVKPGSRSRKYSRNVQRLAKLYERKIEKVIFSLALRS